MGVANGGGVAGRRIGSSRHRHRHRLGRRTFGFDEREAAREVLGHAPPAWQANDLPPVDIYVGAPADPPQSPWNDACGVWGFAVPAPAANAATGSMGTFFGNPRGARLVEDGFITTAVSFDGADDRFEAEVDPCGPELTAYAWVRQLSAEAGITPIVAANGGRKNGQRVDWGLAIVDGQELQAHGRSTGTVIVAADYPEDGEWHHVGLRWTAGGLSLFLDGFQVGGGDLTPPPNALMEPVISIAGFVGGPNTGSVAHLAGLVDEVTVFAGDPSDAWFQAVAENQATPESTYLVGAPYPL